MAASKALNSGDVVITYDGVDVSAGNFNLHNFNGKVVSGDSYYVKKAIELGASEKPKRKTRKAAE